MKFLENTYVKVESEQECEECIKFFEDAFGIKWQYGKINMAEYALDKNRWIVIYYSRGSARPFQWGVLDSEYEKNLNNGWKSEWFRNIRNPENRKIYIRFNDFHSAQITKKGIKFPWRESVFPLEVIRQLMAARKSLKEEATNYIRSGNGVWHKDENNRWSKIYD